MFRGVVGPLSSAGPCLFESSPQCTEPRTLIEYIVVCFCACVANICTCAQCHVMAVILHRVTPRESPCHERHIILRPSLFCQDFPWCVLARASSRGCVVKCGSNWEFYDCDGHWNFRGIRGLGTGRSDWKVVFLSVHSNYAETVGLGTVINILGINTQFLRRELQSGIINYVSIKRKFDISLNYQTNQ